MLIHQNSHCCHMYGCGFLLQTPYTHHWNEMKKFVTIEFIRTLLYVNSICDSLRRFILCKSRSLLLSIAKGSQSYRYMYALIYSEIYIN